MGLHGEEVVPESRLSQLPAFMGPWFRLGWDFRLTIVYLTSAFVFFVSYSLVLSPIVVPVRFLSGLVTLIVVQGAILTTLVLPKQVMDIGTTLLSGIVLTVLETHLLYNVTLLGFRISLMPWMLLMSSCTLGLGLLLLRLGNRQHDLADAIRFRWHKSLVMILVLGLLVRMILLYFAQGSIAPDASLYADYARNIMNGTFESSVSNDSAVLAIGTDVDYVAHQAMTYVFAVSWLLASPGTSGPTLILALIGLVLLFPCFSLTERWFGTAAATWSTCLIAIHPLFVFHSAVGYGPEITSLLFVMYGTLLMVECQDSSKGVLLGVGILIGLVDAIWYADFYLACITFPVVFLVARRLGRGRNLSFSLLLPLVLIARLYYSNVFVFYGMYALLYFLLATVKRLKPTLGIGRYTPFFVGIMVAEVAWIWPLQAKAYFAGQITVFQGEQLASVVLAPLPPSTIASFAFFLVFHLTPVLACVVPLALTRGRNKQMSLILVATALVAAAGTLRVLSVVEGSLELQYLYSDSRFFLLLTMLFVISLGAFFAAESSEPNTNSTLELPAAFLPKRRRRALVLASIILVGFVPSYLAIPYGLDLVNIEKRYAWQDLPDIVSQISGIDSVYLADRGREFSWFTGRRSAILSFSQAGLPLANASKQLAALAHQFKASYLLVDPYTVAHWRTISELLDYPIAVGSSIPLLTNTVLIPESENITGPLVSLTLVAQTPPSSSGEHTRIFRFENLSYTRVWNADLLSPGWGATNDGAIVNLGGYPALVIGDLENHTSTWRPAHFDLNLSVNEGFLLFNVFNLSARVARIEVWNSAADFVNYALALTTDEYYCPLDHVNIGDIHIVIEGSPSGTVIIPSISLWDVQGV